MKYPNTIIMAPLRGVTTYQFRRVYSRYFRGVDEAMAPFIPLTQTTKVNLSMLRDLLPENNSNSYPIIPQVLGHDSLILPPYLDTFFDLGFSEVNWNLGCPAPQVTKKNKGSALISQPEKIEAFISVLKAYGHFKVSVKVRLGLQSKEELFSSLPLFDALGVDELIIHPRLATQNYSGVADRLAYKEVQEKTSVPCTYNGDLFTVGHFEETRDVYGIDINRIMVGRGLLLNPYLPAMIKGEEVPDNPNKHIHHFLQELFEEYRHSFSGVTPVFGRLKEYWQYLKYSFPGAEKLVKKLMKCTAEEKFHKTTAKILSEVAYQAPLSNPRIDY